MGVKDAAWFALNATRPFFFFFLHTHVGHSLFNQLSLVRRDSSSFGSSSRSFKTKTFSLPGKITLCRDTDTQNFRTTAPNMMTRKWRVYTDGARVTKKKRLILTLSRECVGVCARQHVVPSLRNLHKNVMAAALINTLHFTDSVSKAMLLLLLQFPPSPCSTKLCAVRTRQTNKQAVSKDIFFTPLSLFSTFITVKNKKKETSSVFRHVSTQSQHKHPKCTPVRRFPTLPRSPRKQMTLFTPNPT